MHESELNTAPRIIPDPQHVRELLQAKLAEAVTVLPTPARMALPMLNAKIGGLTDAEVLKLVAVFEDMLDEAYGLEPECEPAPYTAELP